MSKLTKNYIRKLVVEALANTTPTAGSNDTVNRAEDEAVKRQLPNLTTDQIELYQMAIAEIGQLTATGNSTNTNKLDIINRIPDTNVQDALKKKFKL